MAQLEGAKKECKNESWHKNCLALFPTEVLNLMTGYINGFDILSLYNCGSGLLNYKLRKNGAVTHFRVRCKQDVFPPYKDWRHNNFRALWNFQSLTSLEFVGFSDYAVRYLTSSVIAGLPSTLVSLKLEFIEALTMWISTSHYPSGRAGASPFEVFDMNAQFPCLRVLELDSRYWDRYTLYRGKECLAFDWLPEYKDKFISRLPRGLESLFISQAGATASMGPLLPASLHSLRAPAPIKFDTLSRELKHLELCESYDSAVETTRVAELPPDLVSLKVPRFATYANSVPLRLQCLLKTLIVGTADSEIDEAAIQALPNTLTELRFGRMKSALPSSCIQHLPRSLTTCMFHNSHDMTHDIGPEAILDLPSTLLHLNLATKALPWSVLEVLPRNLVLWVQFELLPAGTPTEMQPTQSEALEYWKSRAPPGCHLNVLHFCGRNREEAQ